MTEVVVSGVPVVDPPEVRTEVVGPVTKAEVGLDQVDNTSDINKPVSTAQAAADAAVAAAAALDATGKANAAQSAAVAAAATDATAKVGVETARATAAEATKETPAGAQAKADTAQAAAIAASLQKTANLSDLASAPTARTNLGLGTAATHAHTDYDAAGAASAAQAAAATDATNKVGVETTRATAAEATKETPAGAQSKADAAQAAAQAASLQRASNLSDLGSAPTARTNLGLGTAATHASTDYDAAGAAAAAQAASEPVIAGGTTAQWWRGDKTWRNLTSSTVGLDQVNNTSDANKPVSTAQQAALDGKDALNSGDQTAVDSTTWSGTPSVGVSTPASVTRSRLLGGNTVITGLATPSSTISFTITYVIKQAATGGPFTVTWPATLEWAGDALAPTMPTPANSEMIVHLFWTGSVWRAMFGGNFFP